MNPVDALRSMGTTLGSMPFVQGPGGNVSVKDATTIWVKASGKRLRDVASEGGHATIPRDLVLRALDGDDAAEKKVFALHPRPSLEAYFHALGGNVVAHTHAVGALLHFCASDTIDDDLGGLLRSIPYVRPGRGVAEAVREVLDDRREQAVALRSHGLVVYADDVDRAVEITREVAECGSARYGKTPSIDERLASYVASKVEAVTGGFYRVLPVRAPTGDRPRYLFPDAVVCASVVRVPALIDLRSKAEDVLARMKRAIVVTADDGARLICATSASQLEQSVEVLAAHDIVEEVLAARGVAAYLDDDEPAALLGMPSEAYRIALASAAV